MNDDKCDACFGEGFLWVYDGEMLVACWHCKGTGKKENKNEKTQFSMDAIGTDKFVVR
jgi:DnaJ-class molecular chaperone